MFQRAVISGLFATFVLSAPAVALTAQEKMETCKFGADDQKLQGAKRKAFISKCVADEDAPAKGAAKKKS